jgi:hypothetical protein
VTSSDPNFSELASRFHRSPRTGSRRGRRITPEKEENKNSNEHAETAAAAAAFVSVGEVEASHAGMQYLII